MAKKLNSVVGIDIGSRSIKVAEIRSQGRDVVVTALGIIDTPEGAVDHTGIYNSDAVANALKQALSSSGVSVGQAVATIAGQASVLVRTLEVPKMNPNELREHMQWEINRNIPFSESTVVSDYRVVDEGAEGAQNMDVVMAISPQSAIETLMACVKKAGKQLFAIDVEPLGLARSVFTSYGDEFDNQTVCLVDIGHKTTSINIYRNGKLLMPRQVPLGGELLTKSIADGLGVSGPEAEEIKRNQADASQVSAGGAATQQFTAYNPFAEAGEGGAPEAGGESAAPVPAADANRANPFIVDGLSELAEEARRSIEYFRSKGGEVERIVLCGGGAGLRGLNTYLSNALGLPCDIFDPTRRLQINAKKAPEEFVAGHKQEFAVAVGNGLHIMFD